MKKLKKIFSLLVVAVVVLSMFTINASAMPTPLTAGNTKETAAKIPSYGVEYVSELSKKGEIDWFKFATLSEEAFYTISMENYSIHETNIYSPDMSLNLFVYDAYNKEIAHLISSGNKTNIKLETNTTYYIKVVAGSNISESTGNYEIFITYDNDPVYDVKDKSTTVNINTGIKSSLDGTGDVDWYKFIAPIDGTYKVSLENYNINEPNIYTPDMSLNLFIYDIYDKEIVHINATNSTEVELESNQTYYIKIMMGSNRPENTGNYGFSVDCDDVLIPEETTVEDFTTAEITTLPNGDLAENLSNESEDLEEAEEDNNKDKNEDEDKSQMTKVIIVAIVAVVVVCVASITILLFKRKKSIVEK